MKTIDDAQVYLPELWATHARFSPDKEAVVCGEVRRSWRDFNNNLNRIANAVRDYGLGRGDKIAVLMGNAVKTLEVRCKAGHRIGRRAGKTGKDTR